MKGGFMKIILILFLMSVTGCVTKPICINSDDGFKSVLDPSNNCKVRIRQVVLGADIDLPKSIAFKTSDVQWSYRWIESLFQNGIVELGHFVLVPMEKGFTYGK